MSRGPLDKFIRANFAISRAITPEDAWSAKAHRVYDEWGVELLRQQPRKVLDVGGGRTWTFDRSLKTSGMELIGFDIDQEELQRNTSIDRAIVGDACKSLDVEPGSIDLVLARATVEHLYDTAAFCRNAYAALRPGGRMLVTFPNKWAPFAIANRAIPNRVTRVLLDKMLPGSKGEVGFPAYYDACTPSQFEQSLLDAGFAIERAYASYFSSLYLAGIFPLYVCSLAVDYVRYFSGIKALSSYLVYLARK